MKEDMIVYRVGLPCANPCPNCDLALTGKCKQEGGDDGT